MGIPNNWYVTMFDIHLWRLLWMDSPGHAEIKMMTVWWECEASCQCECATALATIKYNVLRSFADFRVFCKRKKLGFTSIAFAFIVVASERFEPRGILLTNMSARPRDVVSHFQLCYACACVTWLRPGSGKTGKLNFTFLLEGGQRDKSQVRWI